MIFQTSKAEAELTPFDKGFWNFEYWHTNTKCATSSAV